jgi:hypothetical protein
MPKMPTPYSDRQRFYQIPRSDQILVEQFLMGAPLIEGVDRETSQNLWRSEYGVGIQNHRRPSSAIVFHDDGQGLRALLMAQSRQTHVAVVNHVLKLMDDPRRIVRALWDLDPMAFAFNDGPLLPIGLSFELVGPLSLAAFRAAHVPSFPTVRKPST